MMLRISGVWLSKRSPGTLTCFETYEAFRH
jgi:hypothetical protein